MANSTEPLVEFVSLGLGSRAGSLVSVAVIISAIGCLNGWVLLAGEFPAAMSGLFTFIVQLATATALPLYVLAPLAALRFMTNGRVPRSSALYAAAVGAILFAAVAIFGSGGPAVAWGTALVVAGWPRCRVVKRRVALAS